MNRTRYQNNRGFTLIELLVVLAISAVILTAVMKVFTQSQVTYNVQEEVAAMQQNVRAAKMFVERDIRMAGSGTINLMGPNAATGDTPILPLWFENNAGAGDSDILTLIYDNPDGNPCGEITSPATKLCSDLPPLTLHPDGMQTSATSVKIVEDLDVPPYNAWLTGSCSCNGTVYNLAGPSPNIPVIVRTPDRTQASIQVITGAITGGGTDKLSNGPNVNYAQIPGAADFYDYIGESSTHKIDNKRLNAFPGGSRVSFFSSPKIRYYLETSGGISSLKRDSGSGGEIIAEQIEDFQCAFILEDGSEINNNDLNAAEVPEVRLVRFSILGRSAHEYTQSYSSFNGQRPEIEDHPAGAADHYRRRLLTTTVKVRNLGLN